MHGCEVAQSGRQRESAVPDGEDASLSETVARTVAAAPATPEFGSTMRGYAELTRAFLNRVRKFDSCRGHYKVPAPSAVSFGIQDCSKARR